jgi:cell wall-associated NlpC family hydrolase
MFLNTMTAQKLGICTLAFTVLTVLSGCKNTKNAVVQDTVVQDLVELKQDHRAYYVQHKDYLKRQIPRDVQAVIDRKYNQRFFSPWDLSRPRVSVQSVRNTFNRFRNNEGYGENKQPIPKERLDKIVKNARINAYPNFTRHGITVANTSLRLLPTKKPYFTNFEHEGQGFPFDNLQNSAIAANTPVLITHMTKDRAWVLVETPFAHGWIPIRDVAYAGPKFKSQFKRYRKFVAVMNEEVPIHTLQGSFIYKGNIGMIFPRIKVNKYTYTIAVAQPSSKRYAYIKHATIPRKNARTKPIPLTIKNVATLSNELLDQPYGWGGMYENRDCSAMLKDLFSPFGIWLPRNSRAQAHNGGTYINFEGLTNEQKETMVINNATPYITLLWLPGHIMLYIGEKDGEPLVFHNIWGLRTTDSLGRKVIGRSVITTLEPGKSLPNLQEGQTLLERVRGMTLLVPKFQS